MVLGISPDTSRKHRNFRKKHQLPYTLLADEKHEVAERYGVWVEKLFWGRKYWGVARTTFVIDRAGRIAKVFENVRDPFDRFGLQVMSTRAPEDVVPVMSALFVVENPADSGEPLMNALMPENCHPFSAHRVTTLFHLVFGRSHSQFTRRLLGLS